MMRNTRPCLFPPTVQALASQGGEIALDDTFVFDIAMQTLSNWNNKANQGKLAGTAQYDPDLMTALQEIKQLKRQLKVAEEEREILNEEG